MNFKDKFNNMFKKGDPKNILMFILLFAVGVAALTQLTDYSRNTDRLSYSTFLDQVEKDNVQSVRVADQEVYGQYKNGQRFEAVIANVPKNWEILREHNVTFSVDETEGAFSPWHFIGFFVLVGFAAAMWYFLRQGKGPGGGSSQIFSFGKSKAKMFMPTQVKERFSSVAGADEAKEDLQDVVDFLKNPEKYKRLGASLPRGVLLVGEPGNGKTLLAKAIAGEANCPFFSISGSDFIEVFVGVGAARIRDLFTQARKQSPCIVFIDEIDAIGRQRGSGLGGGHDEREQTLNQLLTELDGFSSSGAPIIVIAATNTPQVLDKALLRPGRFDRRVEVPYPDEKDRKEILQIHGKKSEFADDVDLDKIAEETAGFSGADLQNLVNQAAINASKRERSQITQEDFTVSKEKIMRSQETQHAAPQSSPESASGARMYMPSQIKVRFPQVAGAEEAKEELADVVDFLQNPEKYKKIGAELTRGALLVGNPGNGKTLLAKAVAGEAGRPFFSVSGSEFVEKYVGVGASRIRDLFAQARKHSPSIVFIDEIDAIGARRGADGDNSERTQTLNQLLTEMDGFESDKSSVVVLAATNRADILDSALMRPGRFDKRVDVPYPDLKSRLEIIKVHAKKRSITDGVDLERIARGTPGFSGADLAHLVNEAAINAVKNDRNAIVIDDFEEARDKILLGKARRSMVLDPAEIRMTAYHEAGHAMLVLLMPESTEPLHKVTVLPRGGALGVTSWLPEKDKYSQYKDEILASIMVTLGGRIAEEIVFGRVSTGASNDFQKVTELARKMVCQYGMSDALGTIAYSKNDQNYSPATAEKIDDEVRSIVDSCYKKARTMLTENREMLDTLSEKLIEKETLYATEIYALLNIEPRIMHSLQD
jgi:cell division protease FtsH